MTLHIHHPKLRVRFKLAHGPRAATLTAHGYPDDSNNCSSSWTVSWEESRPPASHLVCSDHPRCAHAETENDGIDPESKKFQGGETSANSSLVIGCVHTVGGPRNESRWGVGPQPCHWLRKLCPYGGGACGFHCTTRTAIFATCVFFFFAEPTQADRHHAVERQRVGVGVRDRANDEKDGCSKLSIVEYLVGG